jgi:hypothetical protein
VVLVVAHLLLCGGRGVFVVVVGVTVVVLVVVVLVVVVVLALVAVVAVVVARGVVATIAVADPDATGDSDDARCCRRDHHLCIVVREGAAWEMEARRAERYIVSLFGRGQ